MKLCEKVCFVCYIALSLNLNKTLKLVKALSLTELESFTNAKFQKIILLKKTSDNIYSLPYQLIPPPCVK